MTYKDDALVALYEADDTPIPPSEVGNRMPATPTDLSMTLKRLFDDGFVDRHGEGKRGDPYRYELTGKGEAAAKDLSNGDEPPEDAGLNALFGDEDDEEPPRDPTEERIADVERYVDGVDSRLQSLEDAFGEANVEREDARHRLRAIEDALSGADNVVALSDDDLVDAVYLIANAECDGASYQKRTQLIAGLIGADAESDGLFAQLATVLSGEYVEVTNVEYVGDEDDTDDVTEE